jgi:tRNA-Thr(GGU) m(6)t(6)A37 methyltransferase TsaA
VEIRYRSIGIIHSPFRETVGMPIQAAGASGIRGTVTVDEEFAGALEDLQGFSHIILLYHFHRSKGYSLKVTPFLDTSLHGVFATRAPRRPNPIGLSVVRLVEIRKNELTVENLDVVDGTPLLDIKPYIPEMDVHAVDRVGWFEGARGALGSTRADGRFE